MDERFGDYLNHDLASYQVAVKCRRAAHRHRVDRRGRPAREPDGREGNRRDRDATASAGASARDRDRADAERGVAPRRVSDTAGVRHLSWCAAARSGMMPRWVSAWPHQVARVPRAEIASGWPTSCGEPASTSGCRRRRSSVAWIWCMRRGRARSSTGCSLTCRSRRSYGESHSTPSAGLRGSCPTFRARGAVHSFRA
jgi:hypothetical protein